MHALLLESSAVPRTATRFLIEQLGHTAEVAASEPELRALVGRRTFDVILIDAHLSADTVEQFDRLLKQIPTIGLLSELDSAEMRYRFKSILVKPVTRQELAEALSEVQAHNAATSLMQKQVLLARLGRNRDVLAQMTALLRKQASTWHTDMRSAIEQCDDEALHRVAHQAKGALANLAALQAATAAQELEEIARNGQWERAEEAVTRLEAMVEQVVQELAAM